MTRPYHNMLSIRERSGRETLYLNDGLTSEGISRETGRREYYISDEYGSPVRYTDENGNTTGLYGYDEYGTRTDLLSGISGNLRGYTSEDTEVYASGIYRPFTFTGYMEDEVSGLYFAQAREYDPASGRFAGKDWVKGFADRPYTLNEYGYCWNSPKKYVDLDGNWPTMEEIGTGIKNAADDLYHNVVGQTIVYNEKKISPGVTLTESGHTGGGIINYTSKMWDYSNTSSVTLTPVNLLGHSVYVKISLDPVNTSKSSVSLGYKYSKGEEIGSISGGGEIGFTTRGVTLSASETTKVTAQEIQLGEESFDPKASYSRTVKMTKGEQSWKSIGTAIGTAAATGWAVFKSYLSIAASAADAATAPVTGWFVMPEELLEFNLNRFNGECQVITQ